MTLTPGSGLLPKSNQIDNDFGFITPIDNGKRCIFEYDYFFDYNDLKKSVEYVWQQQKQIYWLISIR